MEVFVLICYAIGDLCKVREPDAELDGMCVAVSKVIPRQKFERSCERDT